MHRTLMQTIRGGANSHRQRGRYNTFTAYCRLVLFLTNTLA